MFNVLIVWGDLYRCVIKLDHNLTNKDTWRLCGPHVHKQEDRTGTKIVKIPVSDLVDPKTNQAFIHSL